MLNDLRDLRRFDFFRGIEFNQGENLGYNLSLKFTIFTAKDFNRVCLSRLGQFSFQQVG